MQIRFCSPSSRRSKENNTTKQFVPIQQPKTSLLSTSLNRGMFMNDPNTTHITYYTLRARIIVSHTELIFHSSHCVICCNSLTWQVDSHSMSRPNRISEFYFVKRVTRVSDYLSFSFICSNTKFGELKTSRFLEFCLAEWYEIVRWICCLVFIWIHVVFLRVFLVYSEFPSIKRVTFLEQRKIYLKHWFLKYYAWWLNLPCFLKNSRILYKCYAFVIFTTTIHLTDRTTELTGKVNLN